MFRIDTRTARDSWKFACPTPHRHRSWRVTDGRFRCLRCAETFDELVYLPSQERVSREEIEFVGPGATEKGSWTPEALD